MIQEISFSWISGSYRAFKSFQLIILLKDSCQHPRASQWDGRDQLWSNHGYSDVFSCPKPPGDGGAQSGMEYLWRKRFRQPRKVNIGILTSKDCKLSLAEIELKIWYTAFRCDVISILEELSIHSSTTMFVYVFWSLLFLSKYEVPLDIINQWNKYISELFISLQHVLKLKSGINRVVSPKQNVYGYN